MLPSTFSVFIVTGVSNSKTGQMAQTMTPVSTATGIRCRNDESKDDRYVGQTVDADKATHMLMCNYPLPGSLVLDIKRHQIQIDGEAPYYRIVRVNAANGLFKTPDHYEISLLRIS
jgi:hypothetical protein